MRDSLIIYTAYKDKFNKLSDEQFGRLIRALIDYQVTGEPPFIDDLLVNMAFDVVKFDLDCNNQKYAETVEKRRLAGSMGGRPKKQMKAKKANGFLEKQKKQIKAKKADNDNDNDNVNDNVHISLARDKRAKARAYSENEELNNAILDFIDNRKKLKRPMTDRAIDLFIKKLNTAAETDAERIDLINTAIYKGWLSIYPKDKKGIIDGDQDKDVLLEIENLMLGENND